MVDNDGVGATLGLRAFTGIVNDEGIDQWHVIEEGVGVTVARQADYFAGQPL